MTDLVGHDDVRRDLAAVLARNELPGSLLVHGPPGVGRQTLALWLARLLVCETPAPDGPCNACRPCTMALDLQHPDVHWFFPLPRPKGASSPEKLADALENARHEALAERRQDPLARPRADEPAGLYLAQIRTIRRLGASRPAMGSRQCFIIGDAELLVPQEASDEAANALLKILEEPPPGTTFILTAAEPDALLPTIRSRLLPVRLRPLPDDVVTAFLRDRTSHDDERLRFAARLGNGSIGRALAFLPDHEGVSHNEQLRAAAREWLEAALDPAPARRFALAHAQRPAGARGAFADTLDLLTLWLRDLAAVATGADELAFNADSLDRLRRLAHTARIPGIPAAIALVEEARDGGRINANPQLTLATLLGRLSQLLK